jgi:hypothetical protein
MEITFEESENWEFGVINPNGEKVVLEITPYTDEQ